MAPFSHAKPLTVLLLEGSHHLYASIHEGLRQLGHQPLFLKPQASASMSWPAQLSACLKQKQPDLVLSINHAGFDHDGEVGCVLEHSGIPVGVWYVDSPKGVLRDATPPMLHSSTVFTWERHTIADLHAMGYTRVQYLPLATLPHVFTDGADPTTPASTTTPEKANGQPATVTFVGDSMERAQAQFKTGLSPQAQAQADQLAARWRHDRHLDPYAPTQSHQPGGPPLPTEQIVALATWQATANYRKDVLTAAGRYCANHNRTAAPPMELVVHGDPGWQKQLRHTGARLQPPVAYGPELTAVYRNSTINLNATSLQMRTAVNQRVFDIPASGGFLLTDAQEDLARLFPPLEPLPPRGQSPLAVATYNTAEDLTETLDYFARHPEERARRIAVTRAWVCTHHTYAARLTTIFHAVLGLTPERTPTVQTAMPTPSAAPMPAGEKNSA